MTSAISGNLADEFLNQISKLLKVFFKACYPGNQYLDEYSFGRQLAAILNTFLETPKYKENLREQLPALFDQSVDLENASPAIQDFAFYVRRVVPCLSAFQVLCLLDMLLDYLEGNDEHLDRRYKRAYGYSVSTKKICQAFGRECAGENDRWVLRLIDEVFLIEPSRAAAQVGRMLANETCTSIHLIDASGDADEP